MAESTSSSSILRIGLTPGEPAGVGPEITVKIAQTEQPYELVAICDPELLRLSAEKLGLELSIHITTEHQLSTDAASASRAGHITVLPLDTSAPVTPGNLDIRNAGYVVNTLECAAKACLKGQLNALVTGPVQKSIIIESGIEFSGHTEFFAAVSQTEKVVMMLAADNFRVALATTHLPLKNVSDAITKDSLEKVIRILAQDLNSKFGIQDPTILVCGLNPHAGEGGHLGMEEIETINPVLEALRTEGLKLVGPLPADTLFTPYHLDKADAVLAMYHDQGLPVLKYAGFGRSVNITLGLPFIRTSVDHGTALDIAGQGIANEGSLGVALNYAYSMAKSVL